MTEKSIKKTAMILLVDSDPLMRSILQETLESAGHLIAAVGDVGAAVDRLKMMRPHLLIIRPYISTMPGYQAAQYLRTLRPGLPVLIVDGFIEDERIYLKNAVHNFHTFPKPFASLALLHKVAEILRHIFEEAPGAH